VGSLNFKGELHLFIKNRKGVCVMYNFPIGVIIDSFRIPSKQAVLKAAKLDGVKGIQVYSTWGEMAPENLNAAARREFLDLVKSNGLVISALCGAT